MQTITRNYRSNPQIWSCLIWALTNLTQISCNNLHTSLLKNSDTSTKESSVVSTMTDERFAISLYDAAQKAKRLFSPVDFDALFGPYAQEAVTQNNPDAFAQSIRTRVPIDWAWKRSEISPTWIYSHGTGSIPNGGMVLLAKNIFPEGYYRVKAASITLPELMVNSPWLEWDGTTGTYTPRKGGASRRILEIFYRLRGESTTFDLYRGGNHPRIVLPAADRNPYQSGKPEKESLYLFSSTSINTALLWSSPSVHASTIYRNELLEAVQGSQPTVYVGFEYEYPEIAFLHTNQSVELFIQNNRAKLMCIEKSKYSSPNLESSLKRELDGSLRSGTLFCDEKWFRGFGSGFPSAANPVLTKTATVVADGKLKLSAVKDQDFEEGMMSCKLKAGMKINYGIAFRAENDQVRIHTDTVLDEWQCPRAIRSTVLYVDSQKIDITFDP